MPLAAPLLDTRTFEDLVAEARRRIPRYAPQWTDFNESDPGITLVELFAWLTELMLYQLNQVPERNYIKFLQLLGLELRPAQPADVDACNRVCRDVHGFDRAGELRDAIAQNTATVVEHLGRISGYATYVGFFGHSVGRTDQDLMALIAAAPEFPGPGFLLPTRNHPVFSWCLANGLRVVQPMTLMSIGLYNEPAGAYLPSILY